MEFRLEIEYGGGGWGAKKVSFTAYFSCRLQLLHIIFLKLNGIEANLKKRKTFESNIIFVGQHVFVHEFIHQTEINIFNNQHVLINKSHNIKIGVQSSNT